MNSQLHSRPRSNIQRDYNDVLARDLVSHLARQSVDESGALGLGNLISTIFHGLKGSKKTKGRELHEVFARELADHIARQSIDDSGALGLGNLLSAIINGIKGSKKTKGRDLSNSEHELLARDLATHLARQSLDDESGALGLGNLISAIFHGLKGSKKTKGRELTSDESGALQLIHGAFHGIPKPVLAPTSFRPFPLAARQSSDDSGAISITDLFHFLPISFPGIHRELQDMVARAILSEDESGAMFLPKFPPPKVATGFGGSLNDLD